MFNILKIISLRNIYRGGKLPEILFKASNSFYNIV